MAGKWVTKATGKTPPTDDFSDLQDELVILLVQGKNSFGDEIYAYINMPINRINALQFKLASGTHFMPSEFGTVVAAGRGQPTQEVKDEIGKTQFMIYFEPKTLPNLPGSAT